MAEYSKEGRELKKKFLIEFNKWAAEFYDGSKIRKTPSNPTGKGITQGRAYRGLASFLLSDDKVHMDYVANRFAEGASMKSIMGGLGGRVQKLTDGGLSPYAVTPTDQMHHGNPNAAYFDAARTNDVDVLTDFLIRSAGEGKYYGETAENLKGTSLDARPHTGSRGKGGSKHNPTVEGYGGDGTTILSAHPRNTRDLEGRLPAIQYGSGDEMFDAAQFMRDLHSDDIILGQTIDQPRRDRANQILQQNEILPADVDAFGAQTSDEQIAKANKFFKDNPDALTDVASSFQLPTNQADFEADLRARGFKGQVPDLNNPAVKRASKSTGLSNAAKLLGYSAVLPALAMVPLQAKASEQADERARQDPSLLNKARAFTERVSLEADKVDAVMPNPIAGGVSNAASFASLALDTPEAIQRNQQNLQSKRDGTYQPVQRPEPNERFGHRVNNFLKDPVGSTNQGLRSAWGVLKGMLPEQEDQQPSALTMMSGPQ